MWLIGRYFLITPKLLTNLEYHPRMRVLNVVNGTHSKFLLCVDCTLGYQTHKMRAWGIGRTIADFTVPTGSVKKRKLHWSDLKACIRAAKKSVAAGLITVS